MAKASFERTSRPDVILTLSYEEASYLAAVVGAISGPTASKTGRFHTDNIFEVLQELDLDEITVTGDLRFDED